MPKKKKGDRVPPPRPKPAGIMLPRLKQYRMLINTILRPDLKRFPKGIQLTGTKRALMILFMAWMDAYDYPEVQTTLLQVLKWTWGESPLKIVNSKNGQMNVTDQPQESSADRGVAEEIKNIFELALRGENGDSTSTSTAGSQSRSAEVRASVEPQRHSNPVV